MENDLKELIRQKEELERRIMMLTEGRIIMDSVKLDMIKHPAAQGGKWAVAYKYRYISQWGCNNIPKLSEKWVPIFCADNREEAIRAIPEIIDSIKGLYEKATHKEENT